MNKRDKEKAARAVTWRACMLNESIPYSELETLAREGVQMERLNIAGFDGFAVLIDGGEWKYIAAPRRRNPGKKQTCTMYNLNDINRFERANGEICAGNYRAASEIMALIESAALRAELAEGLEHLESELGYETVAEQMEPEVVASELDVVREILGNDQNIAVTQKRPGCCIWVSGDTKPHRETLKEYGFRWAPKKSAWYWKPQAA